MLNIRPFQTSDLKMSQQTPVKTTLNDQIRRTPISSGRTPLSSRKTPRSCGKTPRSSGRTPRTSGKTPRSSGRTPRSSMKATTPVNSARSRRGLRSSCKLKHTPTASSGLQECIDSILKAEKSSTHKRNVKREKVISEILESEKKYQQQLCTVIQCFYNPVRKTGIIPDDVTDIIFSNITAIKAVNQELLIHLEAFNVGKAFLLLAPYLKLYSTYANSFDRAASTLEEWSRNSQDFAEFKRIQEAKPSCRSLKLHALLITPIQRIPRYKLLLEELLEKTSKDHEDYDQLKEATKQVSAIAFNINEQLKEHDNFQKMLNIQNCMVGDGAPRILAPGRRFIKEGALKKVSKKGNKYHDRMFFLFSDILVYAKPTFLENTDSARTFTCRCIINLLTCSVECVLGDHKVPGAGALFKVSFGDDCLFLFHEDQNVALSWVDTIQAAITRVKRNSASLRKTNSTATFSPIPMIKRSRVRTSLRFQTKRKRSDAENNPTFQDSLYPMRKYLQSLKLSQAQETPSKRRKFTKSQVEQNKKAKEFTQDETKYETPEKKLDEAIFYTPATSMSKQKDRQTTKDKALHSVRSGKVTSAKKKISRRQPVRINAQSSEMTNEAFCTIL